jgi:competence protein ComGC
MAPVLLLPSLVAGESVVVAAGAVASVKVLDDLEELDLDEVVRVPSMTDWGADNMVKTVRSL